MKNILIALVSLFSILFAVATVATAQSRPACDVTYPRGSCEARACQLERDVDALAFGMCVDQATFDARHQALQARADNLAGACHADIVGARNDTIQSMLANLDELCAGRPVTIRGQVVTPPRRVSNPPRRDRGRDRRPEQPSRQPETPRPAREPDWHVDCSPAMGVHMTAGGCECIQTLTRGGARRAMMTRLNVAQRTVGYFCPPDEAVSIQYLERELDRRAAAQEVRDAGQDRRIGHAQRTADDARRAAEQARREAAAAGRDRPTSIEERLHFDLLGRARLVIPGQAGDGAPLAIGTGLGLRLRWRCNACSPRDEFYFSIAGGFGYTGQDIGGTAFGETGIGYTRYLDVDRQFALSFGALAYGFGLMGREAAPTEEGLHGDLRRWGVGGEVLLDISLTGGSPAARPTRTEVRLQFGVGITYDTAFWWSDQDGLMRAAGIGFAPTLGVVINP